MAFLLDTNHCFLLIARDPRLVPVLRRRPAEHLSISVIVAGELLYGAGISQRSAENLGAVAEFLGQIDQHMISPATAEHYSDLNRRRSFDVARLGFTDNDLWIAATALQNGLVIVSDDADYQRMAEVSALVVENWLR